jgi:hypothetical protein
LFSSAADWIVFQNDIMEEIRDSNADADTQLIFIFDCCRQPIDTAVAKGGGGDPLDAQAATVGGYAVPKGSVELSGLATIILFGVRAFGFASDGGSDITCSVLTQAIVDTARDPSKITQPAIMFFMAVNTQVRRLEGHSHSQLEVEGEVLFEFAEKPAPTTAAVGSATAKGSNTEKVHALLDRLKVGQLKANEQLVLALDNNCIFQPADLQGVSAEDLREAGIPSIAARRIVAAAGKEEQLAPSTVEIKPKQTNQKNMVRVHTVFVAYARAVAVMVG